MARYDNVARLVRFLERLRESRAGLSLRAAADELGVSERTARRYIEALRRCGYDVDGDDGRYRLKRTAATEPSWTVAERRQLVMSAVAGAVLGGTPLVPTPELVAERLLVTPRQRNLFARVQVPLRTPGALGIDYRQHEHTIAALLKAIDERTTVRASYFTAGRNQTTVRNLDPYTFYYDPTLESLYVFAYCHLRREVRTFAVQRFRSLRPLRRVFEVDAEFSVEKHLAGAFRVYRGKGTSRVVVHVSKAIAPRMAERTWHSSQEVRWLRDRSLELSLEVEGAEEVRAWVLGLGSEVRVLEPAWLATWVRDEAARVHGSYGRSRGAKSGVARGQL